METTTNELEANGTTPTRAAAARGRRNGAVGALAGALLLAGPALAEPARTTADLNLREGPGTGYRIVAAMPRGSLVDVRTCVRAWCEVGHRGRVGWASRRHLRLGAAPGPVRPGPVRPDPAWPAPPPPPPRVDPPRAAPASCDARRARWLVGERATERRLEAALDASGARRLRVEEPGYAYTQELRRDRLTVRVDRREIVVDVACR
ncbi:I78 family peptidase inhibitor [Salinarimonas rosea]|uniref:I78 family peptidase inhibitor n=1 Tax=Salinarimonas rosea TaxID=552063 RepID=UPI0004071745|nr:I78 family peptidase inhibitor [Salinarimonas rosea]